MMVDDDWPGHHIHRVLLIEVRTGTDNMTDSWLINVFNLVPVRCEYVLVLVLTTKEEPVSKKSKIALAKCDVDKKIIITTILVRSHGCVSSPLFKTLVTIARLCTDVHKVCLLQKVSVILKSHFVYPMLKKSL